nr:MULTISPECIES: metallophosphoesterase family protein [unclassified Streptococcus]
MLWSFRKPAGPKKKGEIIVFKILQLTDLHFGEIHENSKQGDAATKCLITRLVKEQNPNFIAITGDLIWSLAKKSMVTFKEVLSFINAFDIPFAVTFGNHDSEADFDREALNVILLEQPNFIIPKSLFNVAGRLNYYFECQDAGVSHRLYFIDSGDYDAHGFDEYDFIQHEQIDWLVENEKGFDGISQLFIHIPLQEYSNAKQLGLAIGHQDEEINCPGLNTGLFSRIYLHTKIKAIYCGHDHDNDFSADYFGIKLNYGRVTGFNTYGKLERGGRLILIEEETIKSFIVE